MSLSRRRRNKNTSSSNANSEDPEAQRLDSLITEKIYPLNGNSDGEMKEVKRIIEAGIDEVLVVRVPTAHREFAARMEMDDEEGDMGMGLPEGFEKVDVRGGGVSKCAGGKERLWKVEQMRRDSSVSGRSDLSRVTESESAKVFIR